jgi:hypothetical protein
MRLQRHRAAGAQRNAGQLVGQVRGQHVLARSQRQRVLPGVVEHVGAQEAGARMHFAQRLAWIAGIGREHFVEHGDGLFHAPAGFGQAHRLR